MDRLEFYSKGQFIGDGTYGVVHEGLDPKTGEKVAIKRLKQDSFHNGFNVAILREVAVLQELNIERHPYIVQLIEVFTYDCNLYLVFEYCPFDLLQVLNCKEVKLTLNMIKIYLKMILQGILLCHERNILHRDIKPNNLLIGKDGDIKLADFGLSRTCHSPSRLSENVVTRWYRAPEIMFGCRDYTNSIDMWSIGCIFAEMMIGNPLWEGNSDITQLSLIFSTLGSPSPDNWPQAKDLPLYLEFTNSPKKTLADLLGHIDDPLALDLLQQFLRLDPSKRISAQEALKHPFLTSCCDDIKLLSKDMLDALNASKKKEKASKAGGTRLGRSFSENLHPNTNARGLSLSYSSSVGESGSMIDPPPFPHLRRKHSLSFSSSCQSKKKLKL